MMPGVSVESQGASNNDEKALLVLWGEVWSNDIDENGLNDWWTNEHLPERLSIPGFVRARRYFNRDHNKNKTNYLTLYDVENLPVLTSPDYMDKLNNPTAGTKQHIPTLATMNRSACKFAGYRSRPGLGACGSAIGSTVGMISADLPNDQAVQAWVDTSLDTFANNEASNKALMSCAILQEDRAYTDPGSMSQSYSNITLQRSEDGGVKTIILLDFSVPVCEKIQSHNVVADLVDKLKSQLEALESARIHCMTYDLMCVVTQ